MLAGGVHPLDPEADTLRPRGTHPRPRGRHLLDSEADTLRSRGRHIPKTQRQTPSRPRGRHTPLDPGADTPLDPEADTPLLEMTIEAGGMHPTAVYEHADATCLRLQHSFLRIILFHLRVQSRGCAFCKRMNSKDDALPE